MSLEKVSSILKHATENKYGVAAINVFNYETVKWAVLAAETERVPIIIQLYPGFDSFVPMEFISHMAKDCACRASVPVGVHLDHSSSYEIAVKGIRDGYPSVMIDGSAKPFDENVEMTAAVVKTANVFGVDVEAELGHVGSGGNIDDIINSDNYTNVEQAVSFVEKTGCGSLAIAVGNAHGAYVQKPNLDFERISAIRSKLDVPLVLHGCSDIPDEQIKQAVNLGMCKFNIATEYFRAFYTEIEKLIVVGGSKGDAVKLFNKLEEPVSEFVRGKIRLLNPNKFSL